MLKKVKQFSYTMDITITITVTGATVAPLINNNEMMIRFVHIHYSGHKTVTSDTSQVTCSDVSDGVGSAVKSLMYLLVSFAS